MTEGERSAGDAGKPVKAAKKPLWRRVLRRVIQLAVVLVVVAVVMWAGVSYWASSTINREVARIRAAHEPMTFADLKGGVREADRAEDGAPFYAAARALLEPIDAKMMPHYYKDYDPKTGKMTAEMVEEARAYLERNKAALELMDRGSALAGCNGGADFQLGEMAGLKEAGKPRALFEAGSLRVRVLALDGKGDEAAAAIVSEMGLMRLFERQPTLLVSQIQMALASRARLDVAALLSAGHVSDQALVRLDEALAGVHLIKPKTTLMAERVVSMEQMGSVVGITAADAGYDPTALRSQQAVQFENAGLGAHIIAAQILPAYARTIQAVDSSDWAVIGRNMKALADAPKSMFDISRILTETFPQAVMTMGKAEVARRAARGAIGVERYRLGHEGKLPETLEGVSGMGDAGLADPFTGKALQFLKTPEGYCLYSAGPNPAMDARQTELAKSPVEWAKVWGIVVGGK